MSDEDQSIGHVITAALVGAVIGSIVVVALVKTFLIPYLAVPLLTIK